MVCSGSLAWPDGWLWPTLEPAAWHTKSKAIHSTINLISLKTFLRANIWSNYPAPWLPLDTQWPLPPWRILPLIAVGTSAILQPPTLFFSCWGKKKKKTGHPAPLLVKKESPFPSWATKGMSPPACSLTTTTAEQRNGGEAERGYIPLCSILWLAACLTDWFVV